MKVERSCGEELINGDGGGVRSIRGINHHVLVGVATSDGEEVDKKGENRTSFRLKKIKESSVSRSENMTSCFGGVTDMTGGALQPTGARLRCHVRRRGGRAS